MVLDAPDPLAASSVHGSLPAQRQTGTCIALVIARLLNVGAHGCTPSVPSVARVTPWAIPVSVVHCQTRSEGVPITLGYLAVQPPDHQPVVPKNDPIWHSVQLANPAHGR